MHILDFIVLEKVLEETNIVLLVVIITTINPTQVIQGKNVISLVGVLSTVQTPQISALVYVRYFNFICR